MNNPLDYDPHDPCVRQMRDMAEAWRRFNERHTIRQVIIKDGCTSRVGNITEIIYTDVGMIVYVT